MSITNIEHKFTQDIEQVNSELYDIRLKLKDLSYKYEQLIIKISKFEKKHLIVVNDEEEPPSTPYFP